jgi:hypothetical protein
MFAKLAQIRARGRANAPEALAANRNRVPFRPHPHPVRRAPLVCHWHQVPGTGALECVWQPTAVAVTDRPQSRLSEAVGRPINICAAAARLPGRAAA